MPARQLAALLIGSALVTFDGTAATVSLPAIVHDLGLSFGQMQWIGGAPLLTMAALLLTGGALADRHGRLRVMQAGLAVFAAASIVSATATSGIALICARAFQGTGAALLLPAAVAHLRAAYREPAERARSFGVWAAWTGVASAIGPLLGGVFADALSWRAVFVMSAAVAAVALALLGMPRDAAARRGSPIPIVETAALAVFLASFTSLLIGARTLTWSSPQMLLTAGLVPISSRILMRSGPRGSMLPRELLATRNCMPANGATFGMYFGMFGVSFLLIVYMQQVLGYSSLRAAAGILPMSLMLFFAEPFARMGAAAGTRSLIVIGSVAAAAGALWMAAAPHPLAFWSRIVLGTTLFGFGISVAVSALTHAAVSAVPESCAGIASGFNHATVRAAGLLAIALLGFVAGEGKSDDLSLQGFRHALVICGLVVAAADVICGSRIRDHEPGGLENGKQNQTSEQQ